VHARGKGNESARLGQVASDITRHNVSRRLFGTSGIRGRVDEFLTPEFAERVSLSFTTLLDNQGTCLVGRDVRPESKLLQKAVMSGLSAGGLAVLDCGVVPTPATLFALKKLQYKAAVMVTGSHVPAPTTGMLFFLDDTGEMDSRGEERVEEVFRSEQWRRVPRNEEGSIDRLEILDIYETEIRSHLGSLGEYRVVVDPGNGAACTTLGRILVDLGCEVITINGRPDGTFPSRSPYPHPSTLGQLASAVKDAKADLGVGTDSDGDRALFATKDGQVVWGDVTGAMFVKNELEAHRGGRIISTVNTSGAVQLLCQQYSGSLTITKVGPPAIAEALRDHRDTIFATEESGKHIWPDVILYGDAALAAGKLLQIMKRKQKSLEELQSELPEFHQFKSTIPCSERLKSKTFKLILEMWKPPKDAQILTIDGLKITYPNLSWVLVRPSGTEPIFRCQSESPDVKEARKLLATATELVQRAIAKVSSE
jgi:phosphomannomutase/phosphoglucomutase